MDASIRVRERRLVQKLIDHKIKQSQDDTRGPWGKYTYQLDSALPGKHTVKLYGSLSREDAGVLVQARTGHTHLNSYLARVKTADSDQYQRGPGSETVYHIILQCPKIALHPTTVTRSGRWTMG